MFKKIRTQQNQKGFTLIELMVVIAIIGILAAIAIPQFAAYRTRSYTSALKSDAHTLANAQEAYFADFDHYCATSTGVMNATFGAENLSGDTQVPIWAGNANSFSFNLDDIVHQGVVTITYRSDSGGLQ
jgi:prepilin-type N-terminal cleavage/methylation domain-containing protein